VHSDVRRIEALAPRKSAPFGGKARGLATLVRAGFAVPAGFAISSAVPEEAMARALPARDRIGALLVAPAREITAERLETIAAAVRELPIPAHAEEAIRESYRALVADGAQAVAVRSSALHEDQAQRSGAGLYETVLGVTDEDALLASIRRVWASAVSPRVIAYLRALGVRPDPRGSAAERSGGVGVVVQALVPPDVSGVMFTVNPLSGDAGEIVVNAAYGLGSAVVDGRVSPDTYRIDKASGWVRDHIVGDKATATRLRGSALVDEPVPAEDRAREALPAGAVAELAVIAQRIEQTFGDARDVEWALVGSSIYVLQARPVTALSDSPRRPRTRRRIDRARIVWSNVNVGEALPGVATPLTWSILSGFSDVGFRRAFGALGCSVPPEAELVGNFRGRIYLNLSEFFSIASQVPGISPRMILALGGGGELAQQPLEVGEDAPSSVAFLARLPLTATRFVRENFRLTQRVEAFERGFEEDRQRLRAIDLRLLSSTAVHRVLFEVERLLDQSGQVLLNVYGNLLASVVALRTLVGLVGDERSDTLFRELLSGLLDVDSAGPGLELQRIAETARRDPPARTYLLETEPSRARLEELPVGPTRGLLARFFELYGDRGTREAEIAEPRWKEDATLPFATLRLHLSRDDAESPFDVERRQRELRARAQGELERRVPGPLRVAVRRLLELVQRFLRMRERLRAHVVTVLGLFREVALDASRRLQAMEPGVGPDGAFFLSLPELHGVLRGDVPTVGDLVRARRLQLQRDAALPAPPDTFTGFPPPLSPADPATSLLRGLGACAGTVVGTVRLMHDPSDVADFRAGEILLAQQTDVGWSPLFLVAGGVVTELGGPLSHASIVAREFGIPAVVNVKQATSVLRTGDRVEIDGARGTVRILERA
jgi:pyruvate,water dikinase